MLVLIYELTEFSTSPRVILIPIVPTITTSFGCSYQYSRVRKILAPRLALGHKIL